MIKWSTESFSSFVWDVFKQTRFICVPNGSEYTIASHRKYIFGWIASPGLRNYYVMLGISLIRLDVQRCLKILVYDVAADNFGKVYSHGLYPRSHADIPWALCQYKDGLPRYEIPIMKIRRSWDRLIFIMGIPILVRRWVPGYAWYIIITHRPSKTPLPCEDSLIIVTHRAKNTNSCRFPDDFSNTFCWNKLVLV